MQPNGKIDQKKKIDVKLQIFNIICNGKRADSHNQPSRIKILNCERPNGSILYNLISY